MPDTQLSPGKTDWSHFGGQKVTRTNLSSFLSLILKALSCFESDLVLLSFLFSLSILS